MCPADQLLIGKEVARQLGMGPNMYTTEVLLKVGPFLISFLQVVHQHWGIFKTL